MRERDMRKEGWGRKSRRDGGIVGGSARGREGEREGGKEGVREECGRE